jgi:hypothetical protein
MDESLVRRFWRNDRKFGKANKWSYIFSGYKKCLPAAEARDFTLFVKEISRNLCERCLIDRLKEVTTAAMRSILDTGFLWPRYFLDLKVLGGFDTVLNRDEPFAEYPEIFGEQPQRDFPDRLKYWIDETIARIEIRSVAYSFSDFVSFRDGWALSGASVQGTKKKVTFVDEDGKKASLGVKNKYFALSHLSDKEIVDKCKTTECTVLPFIKKDEPAACRTVQCYDTYSLIRCSFLEQALGDLNGGGFWTTIGLSDVDRLNFRRNLFSKKVNWICTDQSEFDQNQALPWIEYALSKLYDRIVLVNPHMRDVAKTELESMKRVFIKVKGQSPIHWGAGVLSGFKFTALLDSILNRAETRYVFEILGHSEVVFEAYQGDDAIVGAAGVIRSKELSDEYGKLGLIIHPQKTWINRGITEYLHEIYAYGGVFGFPARVFKAIAWASPNTGLGSTFGEAKFRAYLSTLLMGLRRGLDTYPIVRKFVGTYGLAGPKVEAWLCTPTLFGGFGAGRLGRMGLEVRTKRSKTYRTYINGLWGGPLYVQAARTRVESACPIPGVENTYIFRKVKGVAMMPSTEAGLLAETGAVRVDWNIRDLGRFPDAYKRKLKLEWKLRRREVILPSDLPLGFLGLSDVDRVYRRYKRIVNQALSVETGWSSSETFSRISSWANAVWSGISFLWSVGQLESWEVARKRLSMTMLDMIRTQKELDMLLFVRV